jgi:predicted RNase H-like nuclease (RuvC/YqgF family)
MTEEHKAKLKAAREAAKLKKEELISSPNTPEDELPKEDTIEIKRTDFDNMMKQLERQSKDIDLLYKAADKSKIAKELGKEGENLIKQAKVSTWDDTGKFIVGWKLITNKCEVIMGKWIEEQTVVINFEDGETLIVPLLEFYRKTLKKVNGDIISRVDQYDENNEKIIMFKLQFPNGKVLLLNSVYVN